MPAANFDSPLVPDFDIIINGSPLSIEAQAHVVSVMVDDSVELPSMFTFEIAGSEEQSEQVPWVDADLFAIGNVVEIKLGYADDLDTVLIGEITGLEPEFASDRLPSLTVRGF